MNAAIKKNLELRMNEKTIKLNKQKMEHVSTVH